MRFIDPVAVDRQPLNLHNMIDFFTVPIRMSLFASPDFIKRNERQRNAPDHARRRA